MFILRRANTAAIRFQHARPSIDHRPLLPGLRRRGSQHNLYISQKYFDRSWRFWLPAFPCITFGSGPHTHELFTKHRIFSLHGMGQAALNGKVQPCHQRHSKFPVGRIGRNHGPIGDQWPIDLWIRTVAVQAIARRYRVPQESVVSAVGTSLANYLAFTSITEPGDEILVEQPTYELILSTARYLGLEIKRFPRRAENDFAIDLADVERKITPRTRAIVICNLHNPTGAITPDATLRDIGALADKTGAYVLVDEVYREMLYESTPASAFHIDPSA